jgi:hypothetical protein
MHPHVMPVMHDSAADMTQHKPERSGKHRFKSWIHGKRLIERKQVSRRNHPQQCPDFDFALLRDLRESFAHFAVKGSSSAKLGHQVTFKSLKSNILPAIA